MTAGSPLARLAPWVLGVIATAFALIGSWRASPTDDEPTYVGQGAYILTHGDFRAPVLLWQPPLALYVQSAGLAFADTNPAAWERAHSVDSLTDLGDALIFESPSPPETVLLASRLPIALATGVLTALAAILAGRLAGKTASVLAGLLVGASPVVYGHGGLATTDLVATLGALAATAGLVALVLAPDASTSRRRGLAAGALLGLALLAKHTSIPLAALAAALAFVVARRHGLARGAALGRAAALLGVAAAVVWAGYGFDVGRLVDAGSSGDLLDKLAGSLPLPRAFVESVGHDVPLPAPRWFQSLAFQAAKQHGRLYFRYFDDTAKTGWWTYFPVVTLGKLTLGSLGLVAAGALTLRRRRPSPEEWVLLLAFALPFGAAVVSRHNLGVRHVIPALVPLFALVAVRIGRATQAAPRGALFLAAAGLACVHAGEGLLACGNPVAWWNLAYGGTRGGWHVTAGSNADWGQGLWELRDLVRREGLEHVHLIAAGPASAVEHLGEPRIEPMPHFWWKEPLPSQGWLAVSTSATWIDGKVPVTDAPPDRFVAGCYRLYRLPLR